MIFIQVLHHNIRLTFIGTSERVCLIIGTTDAITEVYDYISEKIYEKPETVSRMVSDGRVPYERHKQVIVLNY